MTELKGKGRFLSPSVTEYVVPLPGVQKGEQCGDQSVHPEAPSKRGIRLPITSVHRPMF